MLERSLLMSTNGSKRLSKVSLFSHHSLALNVEARSNSFDEKVAKRASVAAAPLAAWVMANLQYTAILEKIQPLEKEKNNLLK